MVPWVGLQCVIVLFSDHIHSLYGSPSLLRPRPFSAVVQYANDLILFLYEHY